MIKLDLPFWLAGTELTKLKAAATAWWAKVEGWLRWPLLQMDPDTCHLTILDLLAWQRDITRFENEPEALYRLRVKFAFINAVDAGSVAGMKRILQRLGVGYVEIEERQPDRDWDVVLLRVTNTQLAKNQELLRVLIEQYGRTCRRYDFVTITALPVTVVTVHFNDDQQTLVASL
uniref:Putative tail protein n=1 Tax=viral metagenome TaxID=1070528 RepID=A0A6H1ZF98_9ZZZZ